MMVTKPFSPILRKPLISNHSLGKAFTFVGFMSQDMSQLNPSIIPPPESKLLLIKERLPILVFTTFILNVFEFKGYEFAAVLMAFLIRV